MKRDFYNITQAYHLINEGWYDKDNISINDTVIFYNNQWHDINGSSIKLSKEQEKEIVNDIRTMESKNYSQVPERIGFHRAKELQDIIDYILGEDNGEPNDVFIYFHGTNKDNNNIENNKNNTISQSSKTKGIHNSIYFLAGINNASEAIYTDIDFNIVEIADICGNLTLREGRAIFNTLIKWMKDNQIKGFYCDCREDTSYRLLQSPHLNTMFSSFGYYNINKLDENGDIIKKDNKINEDKVKFLPVIFILQSWFKTLNTDDKEDIRNAINNI